MRHSRATGGVLAALLAGGRNFFHEPGNRRRIEFLGPFFLESYGPICSPAISGKWIGGEWGYQTIDPLPVSKLAIPKEKPQKIRERMWRRPEGSELGRAAQESEPPPPLFLKPAIPNAAKDPLEKVGTQKGASLPKAANCGRGAGPADS